MTTSGDSGGGWLCDSSRRRRVGRPLLLGRLLGAREKVRSVMREVSPGLDEKKKERDGGRAAMRVDGVRRDGRREEAAKSSSSLPAVRCEVWTLQAGGDSVVKVDGKEEKSRLKRNQQQQNV
ncbi:unnamed protein product [Lactuca virosa]|uniref:Uncharacterized protein n=1 Tax=Lactuca virosa TaxID=75947 RepID=A0AAU9M9Z4_9ASTR|nr:unnamed protein product [Lactuca virosa]